MEQFDPFRRKRMGAAARALAPHGFTLNRRRGIELSRYEPFALFAKPEEYFAAAHGAIESTPVEAYEYGYSSRDTDGKRTYRSALVIAIEHQWVNGGACFSPNYKEWGGVASAQDFDRLYLVRAASDADGQRAITPALREVCVRIGFKGGVELRPGLLLYSPYDYRFDAEKSVMALDIGAAFLRALQLKSGHPMR
jgi:hypothetical protein